MYIRRREREKGQQKVLCLWASRYGTGVACARSRERRPIYICGVALEKWIFLKQEVGEDREWGVFLFNLLDVNGMYGILMYLGGSSAKRALLAEEQEYVLWIRRFFLGL